MTSRRSRLSVRRISVAAVVVAAAACGDTTEARVCGPIEHQPLDPAALVHVLGDGADVDYATDPPTSGPHATGPGIHGVIEKPMSRPVQVGVLERGDVLVQHAPDLPPSQTERIEALVGSRVVVAPNPDLPTAVVATSWTYALRCSAVDVDALREFIRERVGKGPDG